MIGDCQLGPDAPGLLVVDDEPMLLQMLTTICERRGFRVWAFPSGAGAIQFYRSNPALIQVALLDVTMPDIDGAHTFRELRRINPTLRGCFMSGYSADYTPEQLMQLGALRFYEKPFALPTLIEDLWSLAHEERRRSA